MPTIRERFAKTPEIAVIQPFAIVEVNGLDGFVIEAELLTIDLDGRLVFTTDGQIVGVVEQGQWNRVMRGITLEALTGEA